MTLLKRRDGSNLEKNRICSFFKNKQKLYFDIVHPLRAWIVGGDCWFLVWYLKSLHVWNRVLGDDWHVDGDEG